MKLLGSPHLIIFLPPSFQAKQQQHQRMSAATTKTCMNSSCKTNTTHEWKKGWPLRSGGYADLCYGCGSAYENSVFCDTFHLEETGWRDCQICNKRLHCGCIASKFLLQLMDHGGVRCTLCAKTSRISTALRTTPMHGDGIPSGFGSLAINHAGSGLVESRVAGDNVDQRKLTQLCKIMMESAACHLPLQLIRTEDLRGGSGSRIHGFDGDSAYKFQVAHHNFLQFTKITVRWNVPGRVGQLLKASMDSKTVLSDVFLSNQDSKASTPK